MDTAKRWEAEVGHSSAGVRGASKKALPAAATMAAMLGARQFETPAGPAPLPPPAAPRALWTAAASTVAVCNSDTKAAAAP